MEVQLENKGDLSSTALVVDPNRPVENLPKTKVHKLVFKKRNLLKGPKIDQNRKQI